MYELHLEESSEDVCEFTRGFDQDTIYVLSNDVGGRNGWTRVSMRKTFMRSPEARPQSSSEELLDLREERSKAAEALEEVMPKASRQLAAKRLAEAFATVRRAWGC